MRWCETWTRGMTDARPSMPCARCSRATSSATTRCTGSPPEAPAQPGSTRHAERQWQSRYDKTRHRLRQALSARPRFSGTVQRRGEREKELDEPRRMLLGIHDVDAYVRDVLNSTVTISRAPAARPPPKVEQSVCGAPAAGRFSFARCGAEPSPAALPRRRNRHAPCRVMLMKPDEPTPLIPHPPTPPSSSATAPSSAARPAFRDRA